MIRRATRVPTPSTGGTPVNIVIAMLILVLTIWMVLGHPASKGGAF